MKTKMQQDFMIEFVKPLLSILFPQFATIIDEFKITEVGAQYSWITIQAKKPPVFDSVDTRTNKEKKRNKPTYIPDNRKKIQEGITLSIGIDNHWQKGLNIYGMVSKKYMATKFHHIGLHIWKFYDCHNDKERLTPELENKGIQYLNSVGIVKPTLDEFFDKYYED